MIHFSFGSRDVKHKQLLTLALLTIIPLGIVAGSGTGRQESQVRAAVTGEQRTVLCSLEDAFSTIAQRAGGGVVSITAVQNAGISNTSSQDRDTFSNPSGDDPTTRVPMNSLGQGDITIKASGSGTIIRKVGSDYYVLTNYHVVENTYMVSVKLANGTDTKGTVIGLDPVTDLAVVKITAPELSDVNIIPMGDSSSVKVGSWALAVGSPYGFEHTLTVGIISALHREIDNADSEYPDLIQTDAAINKGNSGGPLLDVEGRIIGINTAIASPTGASVGLGFAIPINAAKGVLEDLIQNGRVIRGWLGIGVQELSPVFQEYYKAPKGVIVASVDDKGPAAHSGVMSEDILIRLGDTEITNITDLQKLVAALKPGESRTATVIRHGVIRTLKMDVALSPATPAGRPRPSSTKFNARIRVRTLPQSLAQEAGLKQRSGVIVIDIPPAGAADNAGLDEGDIITRFNDKPVTSQSQFDSMLDGVSIGGIVVLKVARSGDMRMIGFRKE